MRPTRDGEPIHGELVRLSQRPEHNQLFDVDVLHDARPAGERPGPAQIATREYRENWEKIFATGGREADPKFEN